jgi:TPR repeat protein
VNRLRSIQCLPLPLLAVLWIVLGLASPAFGQQTNTPSQPTTNAVPTAAEIAFQETKARAEKGDAAAQAQVSLMYLQGNGAPQDSTEGLKWLRKAAEQGNAYAQGFLGFMYSVGGIVPKDGAEAVKWLRKAAEQGSARAQLSLGEQYCMGNGVKKDYAEAVKWFRKAADQGDAMAQFDLGSRFFLGQGVRQDYREAYKWYRKAAEQGLADAQCQLGTMLEPDGQLPPDDAEAVKWWRKAAEQGDARGQDGLGGMYQFGQGVPKDYVEAYKWYNLAAAQNETNSSRHRDSVAKYMTPSQIAEGQRLSREFVAHKEGGASNGTDGQNPVAVGNTPRATGTGFFVTEDGCLLTCYHVVQDAARIDVRTKAGTFAAKVVKADKANDVALLQVAGTFSALPVGLSRGVKLGESVFTIGFPNIELQGFAPKLTKGEISSLTGVQDDPREFQISVVVQPGNSGGPLVNQYGNVVGIVAAQLADIATLETTGSLPQNVNYAVKSSVLNVLLESLPELSAKLREPNPVKDRKFEDVEKDAEGAVALILVY